MVFNDPEQLSEFLMPVVGKLFLRPVIGSSFNTEINLKRLENIGLFSVSSSSLLAIKEPSKDFFALTVPLSNSFTVKQSRHIKEYDHSMAHMLIPDSPFQISAKKNAHYLVINFFLEPIIEYEKKVLQSSNSRLLSMDTDVSLNKYRFNPLLTNVARAWSVLNNELNINPIALKELEDNLFSSLILYSGNDDLNQKTKYQNNNFHLLKAEEYINESLKTAITRDQLAGISNCSIRTLSRQFQKKHGIGPMEYIKQLRLNSTYLELLRSNHEDTSVTKTAMSYGFSHFGKFAIAFKHRFGESPSVTLSR